MTSAFRNIKCVRINDAVSNYHTLGYYCMLNSTGNLI